MKQLLITAVLAAPAMLAGAQNIDLKVTGTAPDSIKKVYVVDYGKRAAIDSANVQNGQFSIACKAPNNAFLQLYSNGGKVALIADGTAVKADLGTRKVEGSPLSNKFNDYVQASDAIQKKSLPLFKEYHKLSADKKADHSAEMKDIENKINAIEKEGSDFDSTTIAANRDNIIPAYIISRTFYGMSFDRLKSVLAPSTAYASHPILKRVQEYAAALAKRQPGNKFMDLTMKDDKGKTRKLSDWCGKGKYVLIDFWASWCGPCRAEMPNVVKNYAKYHSKGFEIIGVSFDSKAAAWQKAIKDIGMKWPQLSDLKGWQSDGAKVYGIMSIPSNVLVDGKGKIVALDLRADDLGNKLKEIYGF